MSEITTSCLEFFSKAQTGDHIELWFDIPGSESLSMSGEVFCEGGATYLPSLYDNHVRTALHRSGVNIIRTPKRMTLRRYGLVICEYQQSLGDQLVRKYAAEIQRIIDEGTAGDSTWIGDRTVHPGNERAARELSPKTTRTKPARAVVRV